MAYKMTLSILLSLGAYGAQAGTMGHVELKPNFGGFYTGLGTGMFNLITTDAYSATRNPAALPSIHGQRNFTDSAVLFDGHLGYGKMFNQNTYLGAKASVQYTPLKSKIHFGLFGSKIE